MKHAYYQHNSSVQAFKAAQSPVQKRAIAMEYFENYAEIVNFEMKKKLEEEQK